MSVHLLRSLKHLYGILDDQESSIYVILWNMLRYTPHNRIARIERDLQIFNELTHFHEDDCDNNTSFLIFQYRAFKFNNRPLLDRLFAALCDAFSARYEIIDEEREKICGRNIFLHLPSEHHGCLDRLRSRKWLVQTMRLHLEPGTSGLQLMDHVEMSALSNSI